MKTKLEAGKAPTPFIPEAQSIAEKYAKKINGKPMMRNNKALFGIPTTALILGGLCMGANVNEGVIDKNNHIFGYENMLVCDGSMNSTCKYI